MRTLISFVLLVTSASAADHWAKKLWHVSLATLAASNFADAYTSYGKAEGNMLLANGNGTFGTRSALIKSGIAGGAIVGQYLLSRKARSPRAQQRLYKIWAVENLAMSGWFSYQSLANSRFPRLPSGP